MDEKAFKTQKVPNHGEEEGPQIDQDQRELGTPKEDGRVGGS